MMFCRLHTTHPTYSHTNNSAYVTQANTRTRGADVNAKMNDGSTPLHYACEFGREAVVSLLLENGAKVNVEDIFGNTPLHVASKEGNEDIVALLLENGADVNAKSSYGWTPLHSASKKGHESIVSLLLEKGADVNAKDNGGETPLHEACYYGHENIVSFLLQNGANPTVTNYEGKTPVQIACSTTTREKTIGESRGKNARGDKETTSTTRSSGVGQKKKDGSIELELCGRTLHLQPSTCSRQHNAWQPGSVS